MLTQEELAYQIKCFKTKQLQNGKQELFYPNIEYLIKLSNLFGVSIDYLVKEDDCLTLENS